MSGLGVAVILLMIAFNSLFAAFELALASARVGRLEELTRQKRRGARAAMRMKNRMEASLAVVQLGITLVGALAAAVGGAGADEAVSPWIEARFGLSQGLSDAVAVAIVVLPLAAVTIVAGELVPKAFAIKHPEWVCRQLAPTMQVFAYSTYPAVLAFEWLTKQIVGLVERIVGGAHPAAQAELQSGAAGLNELLAEARALRVKRLISREQERVIVGAQRLTHRTVADIMVPAAEIKMLNADDPLTQHLITVHLEAHTRFLVTERRGSPQGIFGYVNVKDLFFLAKTHPANPSIREIVRPLVVVTPHLPIGEALGHMLAEHLHLALVRGVDGEVKGMITLEDILEELVGDIQDEFDRLPPVLRPAGRQFLAGGGVTVSRLREALKSPELAAGFPPSTTLDEWLERELGSRKKAGEALEVDGVRVLIRKTRRDRVMEALIQPVAASGP